MLKNCFLTMLALLISSISWAQTYTTFSGNVYDTDLKPISHATVKLIAKNGSKTVVADKDGKFVLKGINTFSFTLKYSAIGYKSKTIENPAPLNNSSFVKLPNISLEVDQYLLNEVTILGKRKKIEIKPDTIQFNVEHLEQSSNKSAIDLLKQLPSSVISSSGNYKLYGQEITKVRINGRDYLDNDLKSITTLIPSNLIDNIQIINDYGDIARLTNNKSGNAEKIINVNLKEQIKKGLFGHIQIGYGTDKRYSTDIALKGQINQHQFGLIGSFNNVNLSKGNGAFGSLTEDMNGDNRTTNLGFDYRNDLNKKTSFGLNYRFIDNTNETKNQIFREVLYPNTIILNDESRNSQLQNRTHNLGLNFETKPSKNDYLKVAPDFEIRESLNANHSLINSRNENISTNIETSSVISNKANKVGGTVFYSHAFGKSGRNLSTSIIGFNETGEIGKDIINDQTINSEIPTGQKTTNKLTNSNINVTLSYNEPIAKNSNLDISYSLTNTFNKSKINTLLFDQNNNSVEGDIKLDDTYSSTFKTQNITTGYRFQNSNINWFFGATLLHSSLSGTSLTTNNSTDFNNLKLVPSIRVNYNIGRGSILGFDYKGSPQSPSINQLLPINDIQNVQNIIIGNPDLKQEFRNDFRLHYNKTNIETGFSLFLGADFNTTNNKIIQTRLSDVSSLAQTTSFINVDGYKAFRLNWSITIPLSVSNNYLLVLAGSSDKSNNITKLNEIISEGSNWLGSQQLQFKSTISKKLENQFNVDYSISKSLYPDNNFSASMKSLKIGMNGAYSPIQQLRIGYDLNKSFNSGYSGISIPNPLLMNIYIDQSFLKNNNFSVRLTALDLLNQNASILTDTFANTISSMRTNRIKRYFLLSLKYNFQKVNIKP